MKFIPHDAPLDDEEARFIAPWIEGVPDGMTMPTGYVLVISGIDNDGELRYCVINRLDAVLSNAIGLLEMAKIDIMKRSGLIPGDA